MKQPAGQHQVQEKSKLCKPSQATDTLDLAQQHCTRAPSTSAQPPQPPSLCTFGGPWVGAPWQHRPVARLVGAGRPVAAATKPGRARQSSAVGPFALYTRARGWRSAVRQPKLLKCVAGLIAGVASLPLATRRVNPTRVIPRVLWPDDYFVAFHPKAWRV